MNLMWDLLGLSPFHRGETEAPRNLLESLPLTLEGL